MRGKRNLSFFRCPKSSFQASQVPVAIQIKKAKRNLTNPDTGSSCVFTEHLFVLRWIQVILVALEIRAQKTEVPWHSFFFHFFTCIVNIQYMDQLGKCFILFFYSPEISMTKLIKTTRAAKDFIFSFVVFSLKKNQRRFQFYVRAITTSLKNSIQACGFCLIGIKHGLLMLVTMSSYYKCIF